LLSARDDRLGSTLVRAQTPTHRLVARRRRARRLAVQRVAVLTAGLVVLAVAFGLAYAGSSSSLADGTEIAGVDVGGLTPSAAVARLQARAAAIEETPVVFTAGGRRVRLSSSQLGVEADWQHAVEAAQAESGGFGPLRGFRRLRTRLFGQEIVPAVAVSEAALTYVLDEIARAVDRPQAEASIIRNGQRLSVAPAEEGRRLDREVAAETIVRALASFERGSPVALPVLVVEPTVTAAALAPALAKARNALARPVRLVYGDTSWTLTPPELAGLLELPEGGATKVTLGGAGAASYLEKLASEVNREPQSATFAVKPGGIGIVPHESGLALDLPATAAAIQKAVFSRSRRTAQLVVRVTPPERTTRQALAMGITGVVASYTTTYGGTPGRLHNVQLVARLIDDTLIAPGQVFSFNETTGERNADRGFQEAPVIINGELQNAIGGGVCQVSTTVFNAAFEAGLSIEARTNHALYISHYPLGRDATVNFPDLDLEFTNDTGTWLLLRTFVGAGSLTVNLYGTPTGRRVETETAPLAVVGEPPVEETEDPTLPEGKRVVDDAGEPARETSVRRKVYDSEGNLLYDSTWHSYYVAESKLVRVGTKEKPELAKPKKPKLPAAVPGVLPGGPVISPGPVGPTAPEPTAPTAPELAPQP
jgi:vancomycin resistance protein YoaR